MKIIDLLNKIANDEEIPKKIKWGEFELEWEELGFHDYKFLGTGNYLLFQGFATSALNDEVEIIEEDKKIEKLDIQDDGNTITLFNYKEWTILDNVDVLFGNKINEIIDKVNNMENNK